MKFMRRPVLVKKGAEPIDVKGRKGGVGLPPSQRTTNRSSASQSGQSSSTGDPLRSGIAGQGSSKKAGLARQSSISHVAKYRQIGERHPDDPAGTAGAG